MVGYANQGWTVYFLIYRGSQKFENIKHDNRISIAVSGDPSHLSDVKAVYAGALAAEVTDESERTLAWTLLLERHPNLADFGLPDQTETALMRAVCKHVSVLDYSQGIGHSEAVTVS
jgi:nitroimidazol reductase NimA-like FMN-containing flavoprotein (pyridoxamine 5'-phosphate oxidase superfamily)